jgi:hypothetical protein
MTDLCERFAAAERIPAPDLWDEVQWRTISGPAVRAERPTTAKRAVTILVAFAIFAAVVLVFGKTFDRSVEVPIAPTPSTASIAPAPAPLRVSGELPTAFPATLALPDGVRPVASRVCCGYVQVWFRSAAPGGNVESFYRDALRRDGWTISGHETPEGGGWRFYATQAANLKTAIVTGRSPDASSADGSDTFDGSWDLYIIVYG